VERKMKSARKVSEEDHRKVIFEKYTKMKNMKGKRNIYILLYIRYSTRKKGK